MGRTTDKEKRAFCQYCVTKHTRVSDSLDLCKNKSENKSEMKEQFYMMMYMKVHRLIFNQDR